MDKDTQVDIGVGIFWAVVCGIVASVFWGVALEFFIHLIWKVNWGIFPGVLFVFIINAAHFFFGWFHTDEDISDFESDEPILMQSSYKPEGIHIRILAVVSIGLSLYTQHALAAYRSYKKDQEQDTE